VAAFDALAQAGDQRVERCGAEEADEAIAVEQEVGVCEDLRLEI